MNFTEIDPADVQEGDQVRITSHQGGEVITGVVTKALPHCLVVQMPDGMAVVRYLGITPLVVERKTLTLGDVMQMPFGTVFRFDGVPDQPRFRRVVLGTKRYGSANQVDITDVTFPDVPVVLIQRGPEH